LAYFYTYHALKQSSTKRAKIQYNTIQYNEKFALKN